MKKIICLAVFSLLSLSAFCESLFTGDGRKDLSVQVESPELHNIGDDSAWIPDFVVNTISDDIGKYSNITVVDVQNAKKIAETQKRDEKGLADDSDLVEAGAFMVARNVLLVSITQKPTSYALSVRINDKEKNVSIASYSEPNCSYGNLQSGLALKEAVADLLGQLDVSLTAEGKQKLLAVKSVENAKSIEAQKLIAQGNVAKQNGSNVEALSYYIKANTSDSGLQRAIHSMSQTSTTIASGNIGEQARNLIKLRKDFKKIFLDLRENVKKNPPFIMVFDPNIRMGKIDYQKEKVELLVKCACVIDMEKIRVVNNIINAYYNAPDSKNWKMRPFDAVFPDSVTIDVPVTLHGKNGEKLFSKNYSLLYKASMDGFLEHDNISKYKDISITVSAETDTSKLVFSVSPTAHFIYDYDSDEEGNLLGTSVVVYKPYNFDCTLNSVTSEDYLNKILPCSIQKEKFMSVGGRYVYALTLPVRFGEGAHRSLFGFINYLHSNEPYFVNENVVKNHRKEVYDTFDRIVRNTFAGENLRTSKDREFQPSWTHTDERNRDMTPNGTYVLYNHGYYVITEDIDIGLRGIVSNGAFYVSALMPGSCSEKAGIQVGDIIINGKYNDEKLTADKLSEKLITGDYFKAHTTVTFTVYRTNETISIPVKIE